MRSCPLFPDPPSLFLTAVSSLLTLVLVLTDLHVGVHWALLLRPQQASVVFSQVLLLARADLWAHDETWAELDGLRVYKARLGRVLVVVIAIGPCSDLLPILSHSLVLKCGGWRLHRLGDHTSTVVLLANWLSSTGQGSELWLSHAGFRLRSRLLVGCVVKHVLSWACTPLWSRGDLCWPVD